MHILGKVCLWLCVLLLIPLAIVSSTMLLTIRNHWLTEIEKERTQLESTKQRAELARVKVAALDEDFQRLTRSWGDVWSGEGRPLAGAPGTLDLGIGANTGLPAPPANPGETRPVIYVYADSADGQSSTYLGTFGIQAGTGDRIGVTLTRAAYPGEVESWPTGPMHVRRSLPANWLSVPVELHGQILMATTELATINEHLRSVMGQIVASNSILAQRMAELNGDASAVTGANQEIKDGLVETIRKFDTERNGLQSVTDQMRRELDSDYVKLRSVLDASARRVKQLEGASQGALPAPQPQAGLPRLPATAMN